MDFLPPRGIVALPARQVPLADSLVIRGCHMRLAGPAAPRLPDGVFPVFFKVPCASGWSLTDVRPSARTSTVTAIIRSFCNAMNTRSNTPAFARRLAFLYTLFQLPYSAGSALHLHPFPATYNSARTNVKLSVFTFPRCTVRHPLILSNCSIVSVMNPTLAHSPISVNTPWFCCLFNGDTLSRYAQTTMLTQRPVLLAFLSSLPSRLLRVTWHDSFQRK
jgi:hypothetical protein